MTTQQRTQYMKALKLETELRLSLAATRAEQYVGRLKKTGGVRPRELDTRMKVELEPEVDSLVREHAVAWLALVDLRLRYGMDEFGRSRVVD